MPTEKPNAPLRRLFRLPVYLYSIRCGWLLGRRFLLLIHVGRRTGLLRYTVLEVLESRRDTSELVVMSGFGHNADWLRNIQAAPDAVIVAVGTKHFAAAHRFLETEEAIEVFAAYERRNWIIGGIIRSVLSRLLGWHYDGSDGARRQAVTQLPLIALRPQASRT